MYLCGKKKNVSHKVTKATENHGGTEKHRVFLHKESLRLSAPVCRQAG